MEPDIEDLKAGDAFRATLIARADATIHNCPLWYGWAIMDAFLAGAEHSRQQKQFFKVKHGGIPVATIRLNQRMGDKDEYRLDIESVAPVEEKHDALCSDNHGLSRALHHPIGASGNADD